MTDDTDEKRIVEWECINGHVAEQREETGEPPMPCVVCGADEWTLLDG